METLLRSTASICPICKKRINAQLTSIRDKIYLHKTCPVHGNFSTLTWKGLIDFEEWCAGASHDDPSEAPDCPQKCGLCEHHLQAVCCVLLEITSRCNLHCAFCFADKKSSPDASIETVKRWLTDLVQPGETLVQLSGGEPTLRDDLPDIIAAAKEAGCAYVQLNTNGIRFAQDSAYAMDLKQAGLSFVFLQFDGMDDKVYLALRGRELLDIKQKAIEHCAQANLGVTLVPMLVPSVNMDQLGAMLRYAVSWSPVVRGIHFQPVTYMGRTQRLPTNDDRVTLDELFYQLVIQSDGLITQRELFPSCCDHPQCGFHGDFIVMPDAELLPLSRRGKPRETCCSSKSKAKANRSFIARRWERKLVANDSKEINTLDGFLKRVRSHGFTITAMAFQDAWTLDLTRLRNCSLHVYQHGRFVPFCSNYID